MLGSRKLDFGPKVSLFRLPSTDRTIATDSRHTQGIGKPQ